MATIRSLLPVHQLSPPRVSASISLTLEIIIYNLRTLFKRYYISILTLSQFFVVMST